MEPNRIGDASLEDLKAGYLEGADFFTCLLCDQQIEKGIIYPVDGRLFDAKKYTLHHIQTEHQSVFLHLVQLEKQVTGLTDLQRQILTLLYEGKNDEEIKGLLGIGSTSTVRNHRFLLREKERQARLFLALMELLKEEGDPGSVGRVATPVERSAGSAGRRPRGASDQERLLRRYFPYGVDGPIHHLTARTPEKHRRFIADQVLHRFTPERRYSEAEVNQLLEPIADDYVLLRRCLIDFGLLERKPDGSQYWRSKPEQEEGKPMDRKKELKQLAKEIKAEAGVYQIRNTQNGRLFVNATPDLKTMNGQRFALETGGHGNRALQQEWNQFGPDAFAFEVLEVLEEPETGYFDKADALKKLKERWFERLQPYGEKGYN